MNFILKYLFFLSGAIFISSCQPDVKSETKPTKKTVSTPVKTIENHAKFPAKYDSILNKYCSFDMPIDSGSSKIFILGTPEGFDPCYTYLVETPGVGSCGSYLSLIIEKSECKYIDLGCGAIDTVLPVMHNGVSDFVLVKRDGPKDFFNYFNGNSLRTYDDPKPRTFLTGVEEVLPPEICDQSIYKLRFINVNLGKSDCVYILAIHTHTAYLLKECFPNQLTLVNTFPDFQYFNILEEKTNGFFDIEIRGFENSLWKWEGDRYFMEIQYQ